MTDEELLALLKSRHAYMENCVAGIQVKVYHCLLDAFEIWSALSSYKDDWFVGRAGPGQWVVTHMEGE